MDFVSKIKVLSWNVRGLNEKDKRLAVRQTVLIEKPDVVCFQETKMGSMNDAIVTQVCGRRLKEYEYLEADGTRGGILIAWNASKYKLVNCTKGRYNVTVTLEQNGDCFHLTSVYGPTSTQLRRDFFNEIRGLQHSDNLPWLLCGDFNVTLLQEDRTNVNSSNWRESTKFADLIMDLNLINLPLRGKNFTWSNSRTMARLDRFLLSVNWSISYPNSRQEAVANTSSDHTPLIYTADTRFKKTKNFRFENFWLKSEKFKEFVRQTWQQMEGAATSADLNEKLGKLQSQIRDWTQERLGNIKEQIVVCRNFMDWIGKVQEVRSITQLEKWVHTVIKRRYVDLSVMEEDIWKQRAKIRWESEGDRNTRYFHSLATSSKRNNAIHVIEHQGQMHRTQAAKAQVFWNFYADLMGKESDELPQMNWENLYSPVQNLQQLVQPITEEEIISTINEWPSNKSPGPDGFTGEFYKEFKDVLIPDLHKVIRDTLENGLNLDQLNTSYIVLIPKKEEAKNPQHFRPISLLHGIQRIVSKVLANRLQPYIGHLVQDSQTGFVKGRQITEGFLYAQQIVQISRENKIPVALFKADIHKAFDTVS